jgi:hypothetical protein
VIHTVIVGCMPDGKIVLIAAAAAALAAVAAARVQGVVATLRPKECLYASWMSRSQQRQFWSAVRAGLSWRQAAAAVGMSLTSAKC